MSTTKNLDLLSFSYPDRDMGNGRLRLHPGRRRWADPRWHKSAARVGSKIWTMFWHLLPEPVPFAKKYHMQSLSPQELIVDYSYSRGRSAELFFQIQLQRSRHGKTVSNDKIRQHTIAHKNIHKFNNTLQNMTHFITWTHHNNPNLPTVVVFLMIHDNIVDHFWRRVFQVSDLSAFDGRVLAYHGSDGTHRISVRIWRGSLRSLCCMLLCFCGGGVCVEAKGWGGGMIVLCEIHLSSEVYGWSGTSAK